MARHDTATGPRVQIRRTFRAPQSLVFKALTDPAMLAEWFARAPGTPRGRIVHCDVRPGGVYVIDVVSPEDGLTYRMQGTYQVVRPFDRISFTWWYDRAEFGPSVVTIDLRDLGTAGTELTLTHEGLPERMIEPHRTGWEECLDALGSTLA